MNPLRKSEGVIETTLVNEIFYQIPEILKYHEGFLKQLALRVQDWSDNSKLGDIFISSVRGITCICELRYQNDDHFAWSSLVVVARRCSNAWSSMCCFEAIVSVTKYYFSCLLSCINYIFSLQSARWSMHTVNSSITSCELEQLFALLRWQNLVF